MRSTAIRLAVASGLVVLGWAAGRAQTSAPDFELIVDAPQGNVTIQCVRGCELAWTERGVNPRAKPMPTFSFACQGPSELRCRSGRVGGWVTP